MRTVTKFGIILFTFVMYAGLLTYTTLMLGVGNGYAEQSADFTSDFNSSANMYPCYSRIVCICIILVTLMCACFSACVKSRTKTAVISSLMGICMIISISASWVSSPFGYMDSLTTTQKFYNSEYEYCYDFIMDELKYSDYMLMGYIFGCIHTGFLLFYGTFRGVMSCKNRLR